MYLPFILFRQYWNLEGFVVKEMQGFLCWHYFDVQDASPGQYDYVIKRKDKQGMSAIQLKTIEHYCLLDPYIQLIIKEQKRHKDNHWSSESWLGTGTKNVAGLN